MTYYPITVVNKHHKKSGEYIGRGSPLGNPWPINNDIGDTRVRVINRYRDWLTKQIEENNPVVIGELNRLAELAQERPLSLQCFCKPAPCHGDVIKELLNKELKNAHLSNNP